MSITKETVRKVAHLARVGITEAELDKNLPKIESVLEWVKELDRLNTDTVEPLASVVDIPLFLREDVVNDGGIQENILANAPEESMGFFVVPKVVE